jgi:hypothetical protein
MLFVCYLKTLPVTKLHSVDDSVINEYGALGENWQRKPKYSEKTCSTATLSAINPTRPDLESNPGLQGCVESGPY